MRACAHCGRQNDERSRFCEDCGKPIDQPVRASGSAVPSAPPSPEGGGRGAGSAPAVCPNCAANAVPGLPFCPNCGKRLTSPKDELTACVHCGAPLAPEAKFCAACGRGLGGSADQPRTSAFAAKRVDAVAELVLIDESGEAGERFPLIGEETTIGREGADIEFRDDPFMSPLHAQVNAREGQFSVRDLGSRNGTWMFTMDPYKLSDGELVLIGSQVLLFRRLGYPGPHPPERDATRRMGSLVPSADIARLVQLRSDGSQRDMIHLSPGRNLGIGRERGDWLFPYDPSMSGLHAEIRSEDADFIIVDRGSRNGVAISVRGEMLLTRGTRILVGDKMLRLEAP